MKTNEADYVKRFDVLVPFHGEVLNGAGGKGLNQYLETLEQK